MCFRPLRTRPITWTGSRSSWSKTWTSLRTTSSAKRRWFFHSKDQRKLLVDTFFWAFSFFRLLLSCKSNWNLLLCPSPSSLFPAFKLSRTFWRSHKTLMAFFQGHFTICQFLFSELFSLPFLKCNHPRMHFPRKVHLLHYICSQIARTGRVAQW